MELPKLREDLILLPDSQLGQKDAWLIKDPINEEFFSLTDRSKKILAAWNAASNPDELIQSLSARGIIVELSEIVSLAKFLVANQLTAKYASSIEKESSSRFWKKLIERYFFFKLDFFTPGYGAKRLANWLSGLPIQRIEKLGWILGFVSLILTFQSSHEFLLQFKGIFTYAGAIAIVSAILLSKLIHESAHALVALAHGVRVRSIGAAFILFYPIMFTEVTDSWGLRDKLHRFRISSAGIRAELFLGCICLMIWNFSDRGVLNSIAFYLAVVSLISSFLINLNPFMRFDGYHMLSDVTNIKNLHKKASNLALWRLRHWVLGIEYEYSKVISPRYVGILTGFGFLTYFYRLLVFFGLALAAYHMLFKLLGILIFVLEVVWLILLPAIREIKYWWQLKERVALRKTNAIIGLLSFFALLFMLLPYTRHVSIPSVSFPIHQEVVTNQEAGYIRDAVNRSVYPVQEGDGLLELDLRPLRESLMRAEVDEKLARLEAVQWESNQDVPRKALENAWRLRNKKVESLQSRLSKETVVAESSGWFIRNQQYDQGDFLPSGSEIGVIIPEKVTALSVVGFLPKSEELRFLDIGPATFYFAEPISGLKKSFDCVNLRVNPEHGFSIPYPELSIPFGGVIRESVEVGETQDFLVEFRCEVTGQFSYEDIPVRHVGILSVKARKMSWLATWVSSGANILRREFAF